MFASKYFKDKIEFSNAKRVKSSICQLETVSFQTDLKVETVSQNFRERMVHWKVMDKDEFEYSFSLSHAYESNQIFVYIRNEEIGNIFLENLTTNVRLAFVSERM